MISKADRLRSTIAACVGQVSETWLLPTLEQLLQQLPFQIRGFHADNGSEYINYTVAAAQPRY